MPKIIRDYLTIIIFVCGYLVLVACLNELDQTASQRKDRIDTVSTGPYLAERLTGGRVVYLGMRDIGRGLVPDLVDYWTESPAEAWRFADKQEALDEAQKYRAQVVSLRDVL